MEALRCTLHFSAHSDRLSVDVTLGNSASKYATATPQWVQNYLNLSRRYKISELLPVWDHRFKEVSLLKLRV
jgi:hypothetical protein